MATITKAGQPKPYGTCHIGPQKVMRIGQVTIWAGRYKDMNNVPWDLRFRLNDMARLRVSENLIRADAEARIMVPDALVNPMHVPTIDVDWGDFDVPELTKDWWALLIKTLQEMPTLNVAFYCEGGHGRTGTALAILAQLSGNVPEGYDPVDWVRDIYCDEAVESMRQLNYIEDMTGVRTSAWPTISYGNTTWVSQKTGATHQHINDLDYDANGNIITEQTSMFNTNAAGDVVTVEFVPTEMVNVKKSHEEGEEVGREALPIQTPKNKRKGRSRGKGGSLRPGPR